MRGCEIVIVRHHSWRSWPATLALNSDRPPASRTQSNTISTCTMYAVAIHDKDTRMHLQHAAAHAAQQQRCGLDEMYAWVASWTVLAGLRACVSTEACPSIHHSSGERRERSQRASGGRRVPRRRSQIAVSQSDRYASSARRQGARALERQSPDHRGLVRWCAGAPLRRVPRAMARSAIGLIELGPRPAAWAVCRYVCHPGGCSRWLTQECTPPPPGTCRRLEASTA